MQSIIKIILLFVAIFSINTYVFADTAKDRYIKRIENEIAHNYKMKELELQYKIYCKELELQKENIIIDNKNISTNNVGRKQRGNRRK